MTPLELLEYFRKNITPTFTQGNSTQFSPYYDGAYLLGQPVVYVDDSTLYLSADVNSLGAWVHIHINPDDGSVVESDYEKSTSDNYFIFTTMATKKDGTHPAIGDLAFKHPHKAVMNFTLAAWIGFGDGRKLLKMTTTIRDSILLMFFGSKYSQI